MVGAGRVILVTVDDRPSSDKVFEWAIRNFYRPGDIIHILHIVAPTKRHMMAPDIGMDGVIEDDSVERCQLEQHARHVIRERFERQLQMLRIPYRVEIGRSCVDCDSIGALVCRRAEQLGAAVLVMAKHQRGALKEFFIGSVSNYALHHCKQPVLVLQEN